MESISKIYSEEDALNKFISDRVDDLTPKQQREVRLLVKDTIRLAIEDSRSIVQNSVNEISDLVKK